MDRDRQQREQVDKLLQDSYNLKYELQRRSLVVSDPLERSRLRQDLDRVSEQITEFEATLKRLDTKLPQSMPSSLETKKSPNDSLGPSERSQLREFLAKRFSLEELRSLAFDLAVDYESFPHETNEAFSRELIAYFERRGNLSFLLEEILKKRSSSFIAGLLESPKDSFPSATPSQPQPSLTKESPKLKVFLCHSKEDTTKVHELYDRLQRASANIKPWSGEEDLLPGQDWNLEIRRTLKTSDVILVCLSHFSITKEGYVQKEIKIALDAADEKPEGTIFIIPIKLDECELPMRLEHLQAINFFGGESAENRAFDRLMKALRPFLSL
jgi:hypothetical protein